VTNGQNHCVKDLNCVQFEKCGFGGIGFPSVRERHYPDRSDDVAH
jgi:hypothetical protein